MLIQPDITNNFIDPEQIWNVINSAKQPAHSRVREVLAKAGEKKGLSLSDVAVLLENDNAELDEEIFATAREVKQATYGNRIVLFAPLYISNECVNKCLYCGFKATNKDLVRKTLTKEEIQNDVRVLENSGQKRLLLVYGEHPKLDAQWIAESVTTVYQTLSDKSGSIRRVNINCAPLDVAGFKLLHEADIGTYQCFQETYHQPTYEKMHIAGNKRNYLWRLQAMDRAQEAGIDDVGIGVLFGLYDHRFELLSMLTHAEELEKRWGAGPHTISFPRLEPALGSDISLEPPFAISDHTFKKIVAITRLAVPYTGLIMSTRESAGMRTELLQLGISQISAASRTYPGAYSAAASDEPTSQQFSVGDHRNLDDVVLDLVQQGFMPSWCTACYRTGRTGEYFMTFAKEGFIQKFCHPNAVMTFKEYLNDYACPATLEAGEQHIAHELESCTSGVKKQLTYQIARINAGERDLYL
jgi:2-iminoacetate synthase